MIEAAGAVADGLVGGAAARAAIAVAGTPAEVRSQYESRRAGLFERTLLWTPLGGLDAVRATIAVFGEAAAAAHA